MCSAGADYVPQYSQSIHFSYFSYFSFEDCMHHRSSSWIRVGHLEALKNLSNISALSERQSPGDTVTSNS